MHASHAERIENVRVELELGDRQPALRILVLVLILHELDGDVVVEVNLLVLIDERAVWERPFFLDRILFYAHNITLLGD